MLALIKEKENEKEIECFDTSIIASNETQWPLIKSHNSLDYAFTSKTKLS